MLFELLNASISADFLLKTESSAWFVSYEVYKLTLKSSICTD